MRMVIYLVWKIRRIVTLQHAGNLPGVGVVQRAPNKNTKRASDESYRQRWLKASGTTATTVAAKVWRAQEYAHAVMSDGRLARRPLRPIPGIRRLHRHRTRTLPFTPSRTAVTTADQRNFIRKPTAAKRKMEIYFLIFRFCRTIRQLFLY